MSIFVTRLSLGPSPAAALSHCGGSSDKAGREEGNNVLTCDLWDSNLFTGTAVAAVAEWLDFYYVIFVQGQRKLH